MSHDERDDEQVKDERIEIQYTEEDLARLGSIKCPYPDLPCNEDDDL